MCDLVILSITPTGPRTAGGKGKVDITYYTSFTSYIVNVDATHVATGQIYSSTTANNYGGFTGGAGELVGLPPGAYTVRLALDGDASDCFTNGEFTVPDFEPVDGCTDEYADNYDPTATVDDNSCTYTPLWRSAWQFVEVRVAAVAGQLTSYIAAELRIGFRPGHPLAAGRPLGAPLQLRATVGPDGYAIFRLGPYLRPQLGAADGAGGYRLDINQETVDDFYVGYELRRTTGELIEHGYALYAAVPDAQLVEGRVLTAFSQVPVWPGHSWKRAQLATRSAGRYAGIDETYADTIWLPCPLNPLPVAWLNPLGGWDFWVFQGRPTLGDNVGDGQAFREASTGEQRLSDPGDSYQTYKATSGVFRGDALLAGLRTLWRSPQAWAQLVPGGEWVPILVERGNREVGRMGVRRQELAISFSVAAPEAVQGQ